jgi:peroxiredoxin
MRKSVLGVVGVAAVLAAAPAALAIDIGDALPAGVVAMKNVDGSEVTLAGAMGPKGLLVVFSCNHCPWVQRWESRIVELGNTYSARGIGVVAVNANDPAEYPDDSFEAMQARAKEKGYAFPYVVDATSGVARSFGASKTPEAFLFDAQGKLVYTGTIDDNAKDPAAVTAAYLKDALEAVAAGKPVPTAKTKALGCSIKFRS